VMLVGSHKFNVTDTECLRQLIEGNHCRVSSPTLQAAKILLAVARSQFHVLLRQAFFPT